MTTLTTDPDKYIIELPVLTNPTLTDSMVVQQSTGGSNSTFQITLAQLFLLIAANIDAPIDGNAYVRKNGAWVRLDSL